jgi:hypothetical protein
MRRFQSIAILATMVALAFLFAAPGCSKKAVKPRGGDLEDEDGGKTAEVANKTELASMGWGSVEGQVTYDGEPPTPESLKPQMEKHNDAAKCLMGKPDEIIEQTWIIGANKGVANVLVFLKAPEGKYFKIDDQDKKRTGPVELRQPHCAFLPHVVAVYPVYFDGKKDQETGEYLKVINDAPFSHNTKIVGDPGKGNETINVTLLPGRDDPLKQLKPQPQPLEISCNFHTWMNAKAWVFDNPYHAVTKGQGEKDKPEDFGKFAIPRVPAGVEISVVAWRPPNDYIWGRDGKKMTFKDGEKKTLDFQVKK